MTDPVDLKAVRLFVHKNTKQKRRGRELEGAVRSSVKNHRVAMGDDFCGCVLISFNRDGSEFACDWYLSGTDIPSPVLPHFLHGAMTQALHSDRVRDIGPADDDID